MRPGSSLCACVLFFGLVSPVTTLPTKLVTGADMLSAFLHKQHPIRSRKLDHLIPPRGARPQPVRPVSHLRDSVPQGSEVSVPRLTGRRLMDEIPPRGLLPHFVTAAMSASTGAPAVAAPRNASRPRAVSDLQARVETGVSNTAEAASSSSGGGNSASTAGATVVVVAVAVVFIVGASAFGFIYMRNMRRKKDARHDQGAAHHTRWQP